MQHKGNGDFQLSALSIGDCQPDLTSDKLMSKGDGRFSTSC